MKRIHIVGVSPRTGTTLLLEAMKACFEIDLYAEHEARIFERPEQEASIFLTKDTKDLLVVHPLLYANPCLYVLCMVRDPRDIVASKHGKDPSQYWAGLKFWNTHVGYLRSIREHCRFTVIRYEDFVRDPDNVQRMLMRQMPFLERQAAFSNYHKVATPSDDSERAMRGTRPISPESIGSWKDHLPRVAGQIQLHGSITDDLIEFGYEQDGSWTQKLANVKPDLTEGYHAEYFSKGEIENVKQGRYKESLRILVRRMGIDLAGRSMCCFRK